MTIEIWSVGKESTAFVEEGVEFYLKRLKPFLPVQMIALAPPRRSKAMDPVSSKNAEEKIILGRLQSHHYLILLDERGKSYSSMQWAEQLGRLRDNNTKTLVFLIGGPWGVTEQVKAASKQIWTLSPLTFPHQLVRLVLSEQIYRAFSILHNSAYHHE